MARSPEVLVRVVGDAPTLSLSDACHRHEVVVWNFHVQRSHRVTVLRSNGGAVRPPITSLMLVTGAPFAAAASSNAGLFKKSLTFGFDRPICRTRAWHAPCHRGRGQARGRVGPSHAKGLARFLCAVAASPAANRSSRSHFRPRVVEARLAGCADRAEA